ncbi:hypothetical protein CDAR_256761 [Caerostris darwini]|uniref:Uncharacterized protein n=1 Tax=Caerostris darwini TaxID=1538125 RepID=A0AAV4PXX9_9ARAC|nr:hypothetical protein CDAR_256761 [Caerostris darwini]
MKQCRQRGTPVIGTCVHRPRVDSHLPTVLCKIAKNLRPRQTGSRPVSPSSQQSLTRNIYSAIVAGKPQSSSGSSLPLSREEQNQYRERPSRLLFARIDYPGHHLLLLRPIMQMKDIKGSVGGGEESYQLIKTIIKVREVRICNNRCGLLPRELPAFQGAANCRIEWIRACVDNSSHRHSIICSRRRSHRSQSGG